MPSNVLRNLPSVSELLENPQIRRMVDRINRNVVVDGIRTVLDDVRTELRSAAADRTMPDVSDLAERIARHVLRGESPALRPVINATGIILHTGLGRAPLANDAVEAVAAAGRGYASVELNLESGERSHRVDAVEPLLKELTGAEAALVVNNNAAATMLALAALAAGREVIVSRGQLIEIGGSYRLPDVMTASGARLREVGTTNKTHLADYEGAIGEETACLMRCHTSNFKVVGFTAEVELPKLVSLAQQHELPLIDDIGSGALRDMTKYGLADEPVAADSVAAGADVVLFSGDKLLGGPQCGIIVGRKEYLARMAKHPLMRAMRVDKLTLAALAATLRLQRDETKAEREIPIMQLLCTSAANLRNRAERLAAQIAACENIAHVEIVESESFLGGGSMPNQQLPSYCVALSPKDIGLDRFARTLRTGKIPVVGRVQHDRLLLDLRTVFASQDAQLLEAITQVGAIHAVEETADEALSASEAAINDA